MSNQTLSAKVLGDYFVKHAKEIPNEEALVLKDRRITWAQYDRETDLVAMGLLKLGVKKGDKVGVYFPAWPEAVIAMAACYKIGAAAVPIAWRFTAQELKFIISNAEVSVLLMNSGFFGMDFVKTLESVKAELPNLKHVVILEKEKALPWMVPYEQFLQEPGLELKKAKDAVKPEDAALFIYTSGTTGVPKAAVLTHKNLIAYTDAWLGVSKAAGPQVGLLNIPLNHVGGAVMGMCSILNYGGKIVMMELFDPENTLKLIQNEKVNVIGQVPAQYAMELMSPNVDKYDLSSITVAVVASQPCPSELIMTIKKKMGVTPQNAYGLTEVGGAISVTRIEDGEEKLKNTIGLPISGAEIAIQDEKKNILPKGQVGEITIKGDMVMKGYWKRPDEDKKVIDNKGYFHTGDMGKIDDDGYLLIVGRKKEMYIRGGENVYPPEVEDAIAKHPDVFLSAVVGRPHPIFGEVGRAYIMRKPGTNPAAEGMKEFLKDKLAKYKIPEEYIFRDMLPLTLLGKIKKLDLYDEMKKEFADKK
ncbi:MAG: class I adenylate-forming enzyme family protein [Chloroflexi bacterium]|nr:class I adenylate-forming enzyme family protein [Chloroflexota bacterium]